MTYQEPYNSFILELKYWKKTSSFSTQGHINVSDKTGIEFKSIWPFLLKSSGNKFISFTVVYPSVAGWQKPHFLISGSKREDFPPPERCSPNIYIDRAIIGHGY